MSSQPKDRAEAEELRPLRSLLGSSHESKLDSEERLLAEAFHSLAEQPPKDSADVNFAALEGAAQRLSRRRRWRYHLWEAWQNMGSVRLLASAAALVLVVSVVALGMRGGGSGDERSGLARFVQRITDKGQSRAQLAIRSEQKESQTTLRCGAQLVVLGHVEIEQKEHFRPLISLASGRVTVKVPPMPSGGKLVVTTADAEVIVHGTRFTVQREEGRDETTVRVEEGLVEVQPKGGHRAAVFLRAGESLQVPSLAGYSQKLSTEVSKLIGEGRCDAQAESVLRSYLESGAARSGTAKLIDESAARYHQGSCAADRGEVETAVSLFDQVSSQGGDSIRADNALARIAQLRAEREQQAGVAAWQRYLSRFPTGLHSESARRYLQDTAHTGHAESGSK